MLHTINQISDTLKKEIAQTFIFMIEKRKNGTHLDEKRMDERNCLLKKTASNEPGPVLQKQKKIHVQFSKNDFIFTKKMIFLRTHRTNL